MNHEDRDVCLKEISNNVIDGGKTVTVSSLSEDWGISMKESSEVLVKWLGENHTEKFTKSFLLRGTRTDGSQCMAVISEDKIKNWNNEYKETNRMLYSIRLEASSNSIQLPKILDAKRKRLIISTSSLTRDNCEDFRSADIKQLPPASSVAKYDKAAPSNQEKSVKKNVKSNDSNSIASMFKNVKVDTKTSITEQKASNTNGTSVKKSPTKKSPTKKSPTKSTNGNSDKKKGLIANFFNSKLNENSKTKTSISDVKVEKTEEHEVNGKKQEKPTNSSRKRSSIGSDESDDATGAPSHPPNPPKRQKILNGKKPRAKGSRIMQMADSSDDEVEEVKKEEEEEEINPKPAAEKVKLENNRAKKRRIVTRTYEDEDGFIKTVKESEEYSTSETEEVVAVEIKIEQEKKKKISPVKVSKPKAATKQGSIMSFFTKK